MRFLIRLLINAAALWVAAWGTNYLLGEGNIVLPNLSYTGGIIQLLIVALIFGVLNAFIRPVLGLLTCPLQALTLGLFTFVLNAIMLLLTSAASGYFGLAFRVNGFIAALVGSIIVSLVSVVLTLVVREPRGR